MYVVCHDVDPMGRFQLKPWAVTVAFGVGYCFLRFGPGRISVQRSVVRLVCVALCRLAGIWRHIFSCCIFILAVAFAHRVHISQVHLHSHGHQPCHISVVGGRCERLRARTLCKEIDWFHGVPVGAERDRSVRSFNASCLMIRSHNDQCIVPSQSPFESC